MKKFFNWLFDLVKTVFIALLIVIPIRFFVFQPFIVRGASMEPNFENNDYIIVDQISYRFRDPQRGEIIIFFLENTNQKFIKRIIGLPGEKLEIKDNKISIEGQVIEESYIPLDYKEIDDKVISLEQNQFFVLGDNRPISWDSRRFGFVEKNNIIGRALINVRFFKSASFIRLPKYE